MRTSSWLIPVMLIACVHAVPAAENVSGRGGQKAKGSVISAEVDGFLFSHTLTLDETSEAARDALVALIDDDPGFQAAAIGSPLGVFDPDDVAYRVLRANGGELTTVTICETDENFTESGTFIAAGKSTATLLRPTAVGQDGVIDIRLDLLFSQDVVLTISTTGVANLSDLLSQIVGGLGSEGIQVRNSGVSFVFTKPGDFFRGIRVESTDSQILTTCAGMSGQTGPGGGGGGGNVIPTLSEYGLGGLVAVLVLCGLWMIRRRAAPAR